MFVLASYFIFVSSCETQKLRWKTASYLFDCYRPVEIFLIMKFYGYTYLIFWGTSYNFKLKFNFNLSGLSPVFDCFNKSRGILEAWSVRLGSVKWDWLKWNAWASNWCLSRWFRKTFSIGSDLDTLTFIGIRTKLSEFNYNQLQSDSQRHHNFSLVSRPPLQIC